MYKRSATVLQMVLHACILKMRNFHRANIHIPVIVLVFAFVTIFPKTILLDETPKTPALDFDEHTDIHEYQTTTADFRKTTNAMTTAMTTISTVQSDISTLDSNMAEDVCASYGSCDITLPPNVPFWFCSCRKHCEVYNNCCFGHNRTQHNIVKSKYKCIRIRTDHNDLTGFFAIAVCPDDCDNEIIKEKCHQDNILEHGPSVVHNNTMVFKNKFCALCNHIIDFVAFDIQFYDFFMTDEEFNNFTNLIRFQKLSLMFNYAKYQLVPPTGTELVSCVSNIDGNNNNFCELFMNPVSIFYGHDSPLLIYRNHYCLSPEERLMRITCLGHMLPLLIKTDSFERLSVIFSFGETASVDIDTVKCEGWSEEVL